MTICLPLLAHDDEACHCAVTLSPLRSPLDSFPRHLVIQMLSWLPPASVARTRVVCLRWQRICQLRSFWIGFEFSPSSSKFPASTLTQILNALRDSGRRAHAFLESWRSGMDWAPINDRVLSLFPSSLRHLHLYNDQVTDAGIKTLVNGGCRLETLSLELCQHVTANSIIFVAEKCKDSFRNLTVRWCPLVAEDGVCMALRLMSAIESVRLTHVTDATFEALQDIESLKTVIMECSQATTVQFVTSVCKWRQLTSLTLDACPELSNTAIESVLRDNKNLKHLSLRRNVWVSSFTLALISKYCARLKSLDLRQCRAVEVGGLLELVSESTLSELRELELYGTCIQPMSPMAQTLSDRNPQVKLLFRW
eukprot:GILJ01007284.1.p1 GENE.GILJ01007284.1~~GILJ01007284.1.p1  ORF type:complete len:366 (+),score=42.55 GILJ01007284.1:243-1340(+)